MMPTDCLIQIVTSEFFAKLWAPDLGKPPPPTPCPAPCYIKSTVTEKDAFDLLKVPYILW